MIIPECLNWSLLVIQAAMEYWMTGSAYPPTTGKGGTLKETGGELAIPKNWRIGRSHLWRIEIGMGPGDST